MKSRTLKRRKAASRRTDAEPTLPAAFELLVQALDRAGSSLSPPVTAAELYEAGSTLALRALFLWVAERAGVWPSCLPDVAEVSVQRLYEQLSRTHDDGEAHTSFRLHQRIDALSRRLRPASVPSGSGNTTQSDAAQGFGGRLFTPRGRLLGAFGDGAAPWLDDVTMMRLLCAIAAVTLLHAEEAKVESDSTAIESDSPAIESDSPAIESDSTAIESDSTATKSAIESDKSGEPNGVEAKSKPLIGTVDVEGLTPSLRLGMLVEHLLELHVERVTEDSVRLQCRGQETSVVKLSRLCALREEGDEALLDMLHERTGKSRKRIAAMLRRAPTEIEPGEVAAHVPDKLAERARPFLPLLSYDLNGAATVLEAEAAYVSGSGQRRARGSHYTPGALTTAVVERALAPLTARELLPAGAQEAAAQLLALRICDVAMGAGAFLIAACEHIARARLALRTPGALDCHELVAERALVARHCLCGVDKDPRAVEVAELSLWLAVGDASLPCDVTAGRLCAGDSLIGIGPSWQLHTLSLRDERAFGTAAKVAGSKKAVGSNKVAGSKKTSGSTKAAGSKKAAQQQVEPPTQALHRALDEVAAGTRAERASGPSEIVRRGAAMRDVLAAVCDQLIDRAMVALPNQKALRASLGELSDAVSAAWPRGRPKPQLMLTLGRPKRAQLYDMFHWPLRFADVFAEGGFDAVLSNPPWVAYAGRAAQPLAAPLRHYYEYENPAFFGYRTLQGLFVRRAASLLRPGGRLGLVLPTSIADLQGYGPARRAHDQLSLVDEQLLDFGDGAFSGVFQPSMALTSTRREQPEYEAQSTSWQLCRNDLSAGEAALLALLSARPKLPPAMFGERGYQTQRIDKPHFVREPGAERIAIREGADIEELWRKPTRLYVDPSLLQGRFRDAAQWQQVAVLVRQTARYPIAAVSDGVAFRNSLLAAFSTERWPPHALAAYLNATPIRWFHYQTFRDARQGMPQVKIGHLRAVPDLSDEAIIAELDQLGRRLSKELRILTKDERDGLDALVARGLGLDAAALELIHAWYADVTKSKMSQ